MNPTTCGPTDQLWIASAHQALSRLKARSSRRDRPGNLKSGYRNLDSVIGSLRRGQLVVISSDRGIGKTTVALDMCRSAAFEQGRACLIFTGRSAISDIALRLLCAEARVNVSAARVGDLSTDEVARLELAAADTSSAKLTLIAGPKSVGSLSEVARSTSDEGDLDFLVADDADLLVMADDDSGAGVVGSLQRLAQELHLPVVATARLRPLRIRNPAPSASSRRWPGGLSEPDLSLLVDRPDAWDDPPTGREGEVDMYVNRRGLPPERITLSFQGHYSRIIDSPTSNQ